MIESSYSSTFLKILSVDWFLIF